MAEFKVLVDDKEYTLEYVRDSVRQFEAMGGNIQDIRNKIYTTIDILFYCGLRKHHKDISSNLSKKISDKAIAEYGSDEVYSVLVEKFSVFLQYFGKRRHSKIASRTCRRNRATPPFGDNHNRKRTQTNCIQFRYSKIRARYERSRKNAPEIHNRYATNCQYLRRFC